MPTFSYECAGCGRQQDAYRSIDNRKRGPKCCGKVAKQIITGSHLTPTFTPYRVVGKERGKVIRTRAQHRDYLKKHGYDEVGNDKSMAPEMEATDFEWSKHQSQRRTEIEREYAKNAELIASLNR